MNCFKIFFADSSFRGALSFALIDSGTIIDPKCSSCNFIVAINFVPGPPLEDAIRKMTDQLIDSYASCMERDRRTNNIIAPSTDAFTIGIIPKEANSITTGITKMENHQYDS